MTENKKSADLQGRLTMFNEWAKIALNNIFYRYYTISRYNENITVLCINVM